MITVIDYGMGNIRSVVKAIELYTDKVRVSNDPASIESSDALIMPGDGAFGRAMEHLHDMGWIKPLKDYIHEDGYFFGICLGYQLLFSSSEEFGSHQGLDVIPGKVVRFPHHPALKVPHMGWNNVALAENFAFLSGLSSGSYFYFIHSYYPIIENPEWVKGTVNYGLDFPCIVGNGNVIATQFHPEKSHRAGLKIIENFVSSVYKQSA